MTARSLIPRLLDMIEASERVRSVLGDMTLEAFEADWGKRWLVERGVEIISEAGRVGGPASPRAEKILKL